MDSEMISVLIGLIFDLAMLSIPIIIFIVIYKAVKKSSDRRYELEKYKAETERMKAEAAQSNQDSSSADL